MYHAISNKKYPLAVIGLGYVGLPIALEFAKKVDVIGFDINKTRLDLMRQGIDPSGELSEKDFQGCSIRFTDDINILKEARFFIIAVPTPIDHRNLPDLSPLLAASHTVGKALKSGDYVVYESTVYPGCTEEDCIPILERESGLTFHKDFKVGYSPERINPGDKEHTLARIVKVVSGCCNESLEAIAQVYQLVVQAGVHKAPSIKIAEAAKIIENTQRDLNIALMNELSMIFDQMGINTFDVLEAASTKWNFLKFYPGLVGGHCIGVDPYYLTYKAKLLGFDPRVILSGRYTNDGMAPYVAKKVVQMLAKQGKEISRSRVLVMGVTFKENVDDIRNSKVADMVYELQAFGLHVTIVDPRASSNEFEHEYKLKIASQIEKDYDSIIVAVAHNEYINLDENYFQSITQSQALIVDLKGIYRGKINKMLYWSL